MIGKLQQMCSAIAPPRHLVLDTCILSRNAIDELLLVWADARLESLTWNKLAILDAEGSGPPLVDEYQLAWPSSLQTVHSYPQRDSIPSVTLIASPCKPSPRPSVIH